MNIYQKNPILPYICLLTQLRKNKKKREEQMAQILKQIVNLKKVSDSKNKSHILQQLNKCKQKFMALKSDFISQKNLQKLLYYHCIKRINYDKYNNKNQELPKNVNTSSIQSSITQFDKQILQFFTSKNKIAQARKIYHSLTNQSDLLFQIELYENAFKIISSIQKNDLRPLKDWCFQHSHYLNKIKSSLQLKLISCSFINILNNSNGTKAIEFLRKQVSAMSPNQFDQDQVNKLAFMLLIIENQAEYSYYSDSEHQKQLNKAYHSSQSKHKESQHLQQQQQSSSNSDEAFKNTQQTIKSIYRAVGQLKQELSQGVQKVIKKISGKKTHNKNIQQHYHVSSDQDIYSSSWESISEKSNDNLDKQTINQIQQKSINEQQSAKKNQSLTKSAEQLKKQTIKTKQKQSAHPKKNKANQSLNDKPCIKKNILDKNNLRKLLQQTKQEFISAFSKIYQLSFNSFLQNTISIGISIIKTPYCSVTQPTANISTTDNTCPTCTKEVNKIMKRIPGIHKNQSSLICRINHSLMNGENYPVVLPNGEIYSLSGLQETSKHGKFYCIIQNKWFSKEECRKVYLT